MIPLRSASTRPWSETAERLAAASFADIVRGERQMPHDWLRVLSGIDAVRQFDDLHLPCSLVTRARDVWIRIWGTEDNAGTHELLAGAEADRSDYNHRCLDEVERTRRPVIGTRNGLCDAFVPILHRQRVAGFLVSGSFAPHSVSAAEITDNWRAPSPIRNR